MGRFDRAWTHNTNAHHTRTHEHPSQARIIPNRHSGYARNWDVVFMPGTQCRIEDATIVTRVFMYCGSVVSGLSSSCLAQTTPLASRFMNTFHGHNIPHEFELWFDLFVDVGRGTRASSFIGSRSRELEHGLNDMHGRPLVLWVCVRGLEWRFENPHMTTVPWTRGTDGSHAIAIPGCSNGARVRNPGSHQSHEEPTCATVYDRQGTVTASSGNVSNCT